ncbi:MAG: hypothetical protein QM779_13850 [Propionicimonas sp.]|uniref:hypothetical protein n=1 Tax=Propionicimonas sp. TaxID=1955623 RepID=UPI003D14C625
MRVAELVVRLQALDPDAVVVVPGYESGVDDVDLVEPVTTQLWVLRERGTADRISNDPQPHAYDHEGVHRLVAGQGVPGVLIGSRRHAARLEV